MSRLSGLSLASFWRGALADYCARSKEFVLAASLALAALSASAAGPDPAPGHDPGLAILMTLVAPLLVCEVVLTFRAWRSRQHCGALFVEIRRQS